MSEKVQWKDVKKQKKSMVLVAIFVFFVGIVLSACSQETVENNGANQADNDAASNFPEDSIEFTIPFAAGGSSDLMIRAMEPLFNEEFGENLIIHNVGGGGGTIGWNEMATKDPDGYHIGSANTSMILQPLYGGTRYDYMEALEPISLIATIPIVIAVHNNSPFQTIEDVIDYAKENPGDLKYAHAGLGSITHVSAEVFSLQAGISMEQVPFGGGGEALTAMLGQHVDLIFGNTGEFRTHVQEGTLRPLATPQDERIEDEVFADVPTLNEKGYDVNLQIWQGIGAPRGLPAEVREKLEKGFETIVQHPDFIESAKSIGIDINYMNAAEFEELWSTQREVFAEVVEASNMIELLEEN